ncbi:hypothetical protein R3P38DRAFT_3207411 [Favolaschia claudopus]|uniref:Hydrophobin n=1 Tax=Favolaschia claudopus TaxID=2862362 RepID=A0AAW0AKE5_9AGAR
MIFKPFVLLASALATLQVANGAALAERATNLCCACVIPAPIGSGALSTINTILAGLGIGVNTSLKVGTVCTPRTGATWFVPPWEPPVLAVVPMHLWNLWVSTALKLEVSPYIVLYDTFAE